MKILKYLAAFLLFSPTLLADTTTPWTTQAACDSFCKGKCPKDQESDGNANNGSVNAVQNEYCTPIPDKPWNCTETGKYYCDCQGASDNSWTT